MNDINEYYGYYMGLWDSEIVYFVNKIINDYHSAEDICQDVFLKFYLIMKNKDYRNEAYMHNIVFFYARNLTFNFIKKHNQHPTIPYDDNVNYTDNTEPTVKFKDILDLLKDDELKLLRLRFCGYTYREISIITGKSTRSLESTFSRIKQKIRKLTADELIIILICINLLDYLIRKIYS